MHDFMTFLPAILTAYTILIGAALSPGPAVMILIGLATNQGRVAAIVASAGIAFGSVFINIFTLIGVGLIVSNIAWAMTFLQWLGACYLLYLAYGAIKKSIFPSQITASTVDTKSLMRCFIYGYVMQVSNPKAIAFWLAITSVGAVEEATLIIKALYVLGAFIISFSCHGLWAVVMSNSMIRQFYNRYRRWIEACLASFFIYTAVQLVLKA